MLGLTMSRVVTMLLLVCLCDSGNAEENSDGDEFLKECSTADNTLSCIENQAAVAIEKSMETNIPVFEGLTLIRNDVQFSHRTPKSLNPLLRLQNAINNFINTHSFSIDFSEGRSGDLPLPAGKKGSSGGGLGVFDMNSKSVKKERKYYRYAFLVLLGIFGLTGPLFLNTLAVIGAHALMASKAALIIVGGVALKKIFENSKHEKPKVTVTQVKEDDDEHDRYGQGLYHVPFPYKNKYDTDSDKNDPYSAYYPENEQEDHAFAPVVYGSYYKNEKIKSR